MKDLIEKIQQNSDFITQKRKDVKFSISDTPAVVSFLHFLS